MTSEIESLSREFAKLVGIEWHDVEKKRWNDYPPKDCIYYCDTCQTHFPERELSLHNNPDFTDAREVIAVMRLLPDYEKFYAAIGSYYSREFHAWMHREDLLTTPGLMLKEAVEWMKGKEADND